MTFVRRFGLVVAVAAGILLPAKAEAVSFSFTNCYDNNSGVCSQLAPQLKVEVTDAGGGYVDFKFTNDVGIASSITDLYFDADGFLKNMTVQGDSGANVSFSPDASPSSPPGAPADFIVSSGMSADSDPPVVPNGINAAGEYLTLRFQINGNKTFNQIIAALQQGPDSTTGIRIAAHVQGIGNQSDTFYCCGGSGGGTPTPEPASLLLFGLAALAVAHRLRRRPSA